MSLFRSTEGSYADDTPHKANHCRRTLCRFRRSHKDKKVQFPTRIQTRGACSASPQPGLPLSPLRDAHYKWRLASSHRSLRSATMSGTDGFDALSHCATSLQRLQINHIQISDEGQFDNPEAFIRLMLASHNLVELRLHMQLLEHFLENSSLPQSLRILTPGVLSALCEEGTWDSHYPRVTSMLMGDTDPIITHLDSITIDLFGRFDEESDFWRCLRNHWPAVISFFAVTPVEQLPSYGSLSEDSDW